jgi:hypothetical protein
MKECHDIADEILNALNAALLVAGIAFIIAKHPIFSAVAGLLVGLLVGTVFVYRHSPWYLQTAFSTIGLLTFSHLAKSISGAPGVLLSLIALGFLISGIFALQSESVPPMMKKILAGLRDAMVYGLGAAYLVFMCFAAPVLVAVCLGLVAVIIAILLIRN